METSENMKRIVVITGGGSGIGKALAEAFARNGDQTVIIGRREDTLRAAVQAIGSGCTWERADVSRREQVVAAIDAIIEKYGKIDVLINNAGYSGYVKGMSLDMPLDQAEEVWNEAIGVNLTAAFLMSLAAALHLTAPSGRIINISSDAALTGGVGLRLAGYVAAKAGLLGLTRALALEFGPRGITVNAIAPGFIAGTDMNENLTDQIVKTIASQLPVRRAGQVLDIVAAALFLASPQASFITGESLNVNGGRVFGR
jgi:3-oxoacyl-[acyl-carrier protein] reductase